mmetsp:Transcript_7807/g.16300  ORF Transcript_7807/g.16300 Transcript_7807/m.16300 type:complete len:314 (-) Transcript_7807:759-1700(-)
MTLAMRSQKSFSSFGFFFSRLSLLPVTSTAAVQALFSFTSASSFLSLTNLLIAATTWLGWMSFCRRSRASGAFSSSLRSSISSFSCLTSTKKYSESAARSFSSSTPRALSSASACAREAAWGGRESRASLTLASRMKPASSEMRLTMLRILSAGTCAFLASSSAARVALCSSSSFNVYFPSPSSSAPMRAGLRTISKSGPLHFQPSSCSLIILSAFRALVTYWSTSSSCMLQIASNFLLSASSKWRNLLCRSLYCFVILRYSSDRSSFLFLSLASNSWYFDTTLERSSLIFVSFFFCFWSVVVFSLSRSVRTR